METKVLVPAKYIAALKLFAAQKEIRENLVAISLDVGRHESRLYASDGARMAVVRVEHEQPELLCPLFGVVIPLHTFASVKPAAGLTEITLGDFDVTRLGACQVSVRQGGVVVSEWARNVKAIDWRRYLPLKVSGEAAYLDSLYLGDIAKVSRILGDKSPASVAHNGRNPALVLFGDPNIVAIIASLYADVRLTAPDWIADQLTGSPDTAAA